MPRETTKLAVAEAPVAARGLNTRRAATIGRKRWLCGGEATHDRIRVATMSDGRTEARAAQHTTNSATSSTDDGPDPAQLIVRAKSEGAAALGPLLALYTNYLSLLAQVQIGRRLQGKVDAADAVQETFLEAHRNFAQFRGRSEGEFVCWLRQILAARLSNMVRHFLGTRRRDVRL